MVPGLADPSFRTARIFNNSTEYTVLLEESEEGFGNLRYIGWNGSGDTERVRDEIWRAMTFDPAAPSPRAVQSPPERKAEAGNDWNSESDFFSTSSFNTVIGKEIPRIKRLRAGNQLDHYMLLANRRLTGNAESQSINFTYASANSSSEIRDASHICSSNKSVTTRHAGVKPAVLKSHVFV